LSVRFFSLQCQFEQVFLNTMSSHRACGKVLCSACCNDKVKEERSFHVTDSYRNSSMHAQRPFLAFIQHYSHVG
jgi:hypothetical protein